MAWQWWAPILGRVGSQFDEAMFNRRPTRAARSQARGRRAAPQRPAPTDFAALAAASSFAEFRLNGAVSPQTQLAKTSQAPSGFNVLARLACSRLTVWATKSWPRWSKFKTWNPIECLVRRRVHRACRRAGARPGQAGSNRRRERKRDWFWDQLAQPQGHPPRHLGLSGAQVTTCAPSRISRCRAARLVRWRSRQETPRAFRLVMSRPQQVLFVSYRVRIQ